MARGETTASQAGFFLTWEKWVRNSLLRIERGWFVSAPRRLGLQLEENQHLGPVIIWKHLHLWVCLLMLAVSRDLSWAVGQYTYICPFHVVPLCGLPWAFSLYHTWIPSEHPKGARWKCIEFLRLRLRGHRISFLPYSISGGDKCLPRFTEREADPTTQQKECQGHIVRRVCGTGDICGHLWKTQPAICLPGYSGSHP